MAKPKPAGEAVWRPERQPWGPGDLVALIAWTGAIAYFFWKAVSLQETFFYFDITEINFPYRDFFARELRAGRFSRWCPGLYCGLPLYSESQAGYLHPLKYLLYPWMPSWAAFNLDMVGSVWLTGLGTYGWLRRHVGPAGALAGAGVFGLSGFVWAHLIHTSMTNALISVPLAFWALECAWDGGRLRGVALGAVALACQVFAGHLQDTILTGTAIGLYGLYRAATERTWRAGGNALGMAVGLVALAMTLAAVQWVPSKELLDRSPRAGGLSWDDMTYGSWHPELLPTLLVREAYGTRARDTDWMDGFYPYHEMNAYVGMIGLALAVVGAAAYRDRWVAFWILLAGLGGLLMLGRYIFLFDLMPSIPILGSSRIPVRYHLWVALAVAALAGVGVDRLARPGRVRLRGALGALAALVLISVPILAYVYWPFFAEPERWTNPRQVARSGWLVREVPFALCRTAVLAGIAWGLAAWASRTANPRLRARIAAALPVLVIADLLGSHWHDAPTVLPSYWTDPPASARLLKADSNHIRVFGQAKLSSGEPGHASVPIDPFPARDTLAWSLPPVWGLASSVGETPIISRRLSRYMQNAEVGRGRFDIEGVTHLVTGWTPGELDRIIPFWRRSGLAGTPRKEGTAYLYRNAWALPRARLMGRPIYVEDERAAARTLRRIGLASRRHLIVEDPSRPLPELAVVSGRAAIVGESPERVELETEAEMDAYLFLADTFDPGWSATLDGRAVEVRPADVAFRAVFVPKGEHRVVFTYRPAGFQLGLAVSVVGLILTLGLLVRRRPIGALSPTHGDSGWPRRWPWWGLGLILLILAGSTIAHGPGGWGLQSRWSGGVHRFTWGAKIEAIKPPPVPSD